MTQRELDIIERIKAWSFPTLLVILSFFGVQTMKQLNTAVDELKGINTTIREIQIIQTYHTKQLDRHDNAIEKIQNDNTRVIGNGKN